MTKTTEQMRELERSLAYENAASTIECNTSPTDPHDMPGVYDVHEIDEECPESVIAEAVEYLEWRGCIERNHSGFPNWVTIRDESEALPGVEGAGA